MKKNLSYIDSVHRDGTIWNLSVMVLLLAFPVAVCFLFRTLPDWGSLLMGLIAIFFLCKAWWSIPLAIAAVALVWFLLEKTKIAKKSSVLKSA